MTERQTSKGPPTCLVSLAVVVADQWSKWLVERYLPLHRPMEIVPGLLNFTHVKNTGVAFGMFAANGSSTATAILTILGLDRVDRRRCRTSGIRRSRTP